MPGVLETIFGGAQDVGAAVAGTGADVLPRLVVHHVLGDFVLDPWAPGGSDLLRYGITGYEVSYGPAPVASTLSGNVGWLLLGGAALLFLAGKKSRR